MPKKPLKKVFVHLGNVGDKIKSRDGRTSRELEKTMRYAKRFPKTKFVGFDNKIVLRQFPKNVKQIAADFKK